MSRCGKFASAHYEDNAARQSHETCSNESRRVAVLWVVQRGLLGEMAELFMFDRRRRACGRAWHYVLCRFVAPGLHPGIII